MRSAGNGEEIIVILENIEVLRNQNSSIYKENIQYRKPIVKDNYKFDSIM